MARLILLAFFAVGSVFDLYNLFYIFKFVHWGEMYVHYIGSKYYKELGYSNLYNATVVADAEGKNLIPDHQRLTDLNTYRYVRKKDVLRDKEKYKAPFSRRRWEEFKSDTLFFQKSVNPVCFGTILLDHGYHVPPTWNATSHIISSLTPVKYVWLLPRLDLIILAVMFWFIYTTLGVEMMLVTLIFFSLNFLSSFYWIGGSLLRYDWFVCSVIALCMIYKNRYRAAGAWLSYAVMVRVFPIFFALGLFVKAVFEFIKRGRIPKRYLDFFGVFLAGCLILFFYGFINSRGIDSWAELARKLKLHNENVFTNSVAAKMLFIRDNTSWKTPLAFHKAYGNTEIEPFELFIDAVKAAFHRHRHMFLLFAVCSMILFSIMAVRVSDAKAFGWGTFLLFALTCPTNYYYIFLMLLVINFYEDRINLINTANIALLFLLQITGYIVDNRMGHFYLGIHYTLSVFILFYFVYLAIAESIHLRIPPRSEPDRKF
ncbi:MAG: hypothetical protein JW994_05660 [Candidatus Omnitrophica bacterium]|nr:hypothetical protein [Candidatus Omnitrophota bacterium]